MNHNGLTRDLYPRTELFQSIYENKEIVVVTQSLLSKPYGVTMEIRLLQHYFLVGPITA